MPTLIRHFEPADVLGSGALGVTHRARDTRTSAIVALKVIHERISQDADMSARLRQEARVAAQLDHPNVARLLEHGEDQGVAYIASEFVEGETLRARLDRQGRLSEEEARGIALCVAHALNAANAMRVVHRDLRPENILLGDDGQLSVSDFGLIQALDATTPTRVVAFVAAPEYAAPELDEQRADVRSDLFSLGVILFETLVGRVPAAASSGADPRRPVLEQGDAALLGQVAPAISAIVLRLLERDPRRRFADPAQCIAAFQAIADSASEIVPAELLADSAYAPRGRSWSTLRMPLAWPARGIGAVAGALRSGAMARPVRRNVQIAAAVLIAATMIGGAGGLIAANSLGGDDGDRPAATGAMKQNDTAPSRTPAVTRTPAVSAARSNAVSPSATPMSQQGVAGAASTPPVTRTARAVSAATPISAAPPAPVVGDAPPSPAPAVVAAATVAAPPLPSATTESTSSPEPKPSDTPRPPATPTPIPPSATPTPTLTPEPSPTPIDTPTSTPNIPVLCADVTTNGHVTTLDVQWIENKVGSFAGGPDYEDRFDLNSDGQIDQTDVDIAWSQFGRYCWQ